MLIFNKLLNRSSWKILIFDYFLLKKCLINNQKKFKRTLYIKNRAGLIFPQYIGHRFKIYNGKVYITLIIKEEMIGFKFGEFAFTRKLKTQKQLKKRSLLQIKK